MATTVVVPSTSGIICMWNGTKDGSEEGFVDFATGSTNVNQPKEFHIEVTDFRHENPQPSLERNGFGIFEHKTSLTPEQFLDDSPEGQELIRRKYFPEAEELVKKLTGSEVVIPTVFRVRNQNLNMGDFGVTDTKRAALALAHVDRDNITGADGVREALGDRTDELLGKHKRYAQFNVWRSIGEPVQKWPLCFVDHSTVPGWDYQTHIARVFTHNDPRIKLRGVKHHDAVLKHDPGYTYHYASNVEIDEVLVFSSFDSDVTKVVPHGAFWDENTAVDAPPRRSIEVRCWVLFD